MPDHYGTPEMFDVPRGGGPKRTETRQQRRSVAWGNCPGCSNNHVGLIEQSGHLVWREHHITTWGGARWACRTSGVRACEAGSTDVLCRCGRDAA